MSERILLCTTDNECPEHGRFIYFCRQCQEPDDTAYCRGCVTVVSRNHVHDEGGEAR